jgi:hypothetical protein
MTRAHGILLKLLVLLTAVTSLFAGMPFVSCRCPDGREKRFCFSSPSGTETCCCGGSCCSSKQTEIAEESNCPCCCCHQSTEPGGLSDHELSFRANASCCTRSLQQAELTTAPDSTEQLPDTSLMSVAVPGSVAVGPSGVFPAPFDWEPFLVPPSTDLVTLFQHLTI